MHIHNNIEKLANLIRLMNQIAKLHFAIRRHANISWLPQPMSEKMIPQPSMAD
ncbi:hypothetical protein T4E_11244 [Trichinella pseudospiralis]|uniref:Uncharacterized protein n=1 Tax=Trichinella pseudospiralis TaxID=6337 RepID=A0A0V0XHS3_TRIPS|nr:hypothetical protein T4E_11244 [Trichinella pseudospiralis]